MVSKHLVDDYIYTSTFTINKPIDLYSTSIIDLTSSFPPMNRQNKNTSLYYWKQYNISSSFAISSLISFYLLKLFNSNVILSPYFLAYHQYLYTRNWNCLDILSGLQVVQSIGICSIDMIDETFTNNINNEHILNNAKQYKVHSFTKINFSISNIQHLLNTNIPIICSIKFILTSPPLFHDYSYWNYLNNLSTLNDTPYQSISIIIVGYNNIDNTIKISCNGTCNNGYFNIPYDAINHYSHLFYDTYIINLIPSLKHTTSSDNLTSDIIKLQCSPTKTIFKHVDSKSDLSSSIVSIESYDNLDLLTNKSSSSDSDSLLYT